MLGDGKKELQEIWFQDGKLVLKDVEPNCIFMSLKINE
jgi:hypothetical protein